MPTIDENGFLAGTISAWVERTREAHAEVIETAEAINRLCHELLSDRKIDTCETKVFVLSLLFARMLELYQAIILLNVRGMTGAGSVVFRSHIEAHFHFDAILADDTYLDQYIDNFHAQRLRMAKSLSSSESEELEELRRFFTDQKLTELEQLKEDSDVKNVTVRKVAEIGENASTYHVAYALLSNQAHVNSWALERYLEDKESDNMAVKYGPDDSEFVRQIGLTGTVMLEAYKNLANLFGEDVEACMDELSKRIARLLEANVSNK